MLNVRCVEFVHVDVPHERMQIHRGGLTDGTFLGPRGCSSSFLLNRCAGPSPVNRMILDNLKKKL